MKPLRKDGRKTKRTITVRRQGRKIREYPAYLSERVLRMPGVNDLGMDIVVGKRSSAGTHVCLLVEEKQANKPMDSFLSVDKESALKALL
jgi:hypothetical protein